MECRVQLAGREGHEEHDRAEDDRGADREAHLLVRPGDRVDHRDHDRKEGQGDHDQQEGQVPVTRVGGARGDRHADGHVAEDPGQPDQSEDGQHPAERAADKDEQQQGADGVGGDPLAREGETEQDPDDRHGDPERAAAAPPARPDRGEDGVGGDDEQPHVDVVHADPRLDEEHAVEEDEQADQSGHQPAPEQDPGEQVEQAEGQRAGDDPGQPPGEGVRSGVDRGRGAVVVEDEELLAVLGRVVGIEVGAPGGRNEAGRQPGVGEHGVAMGLDHVDGPRPTRRCAGRETQDVDHLAGLVVGDERAEARQRVRPQSEGALVDGPLLRHISPDGDDVVLRFGARPERRVHPGLVQPGDAGQAVRSSVERDRRDDRGPFRVDEGDPVGGRDGDPVDRIDVDPGQRPIGDGRVERGPDVSGPRVAEGDRGPGRRRIEASLELGRAARVEDVGQGRRDGRVVGHVVHRRCQGRPAAAGRQVGDVLEGESIRARRPTRDPPSRDGRTMPRPRRRRCR